jgi:hypothetical protein
MLGMNGKELAVRIADKIPGQNILFMSGFTDNIIKPMGVLGEEIPILLVCDIGRGVPITVAYLRPRFAYVPHAPAK